MCVCDPGLPIYLLQVVSELISPFLSSFAGLVEHNMRFGRVNEADSTDKDA